MEYMLDRTAGYDSSALTFCQCKEALLWNRAPTVPKEGFFPRLLVKHIHLKQRSVSFWPEAWNDTRDPAVTKIALNRSAEDEKK